MQKQINGGYVLIVGPSGAGKDTLIALARKALAGDERFHFPARVVTRAADDFERHDSLSMAEFEAQEASGAWALAWRAHGNGYALPASTLALVQNGAVVVSNVSRASVAEARARLPVLAVVEITASPGVLAARIAARGRDGDLGAGLASRLARSKAITPFYPDVSLINEGAPETAAARLVAVLRARAGRPWSKIPSY